MGVWVCLRQWACPMVPRVTFDVVNLLFIVVCGCGPTINLAINLADFSYIHVLCAGGGWVSVGVSCVARVTFDVDLCDLIIIKSQSLYKVES